MPTSPRSPAPDITDDLDTRIRAAHEALQACDRALKAAEVRVEGLREQQRQRRLDLGRLLLEAKAKTARGQWGLHLTILGITSQRASECMRVADYQAESPTSPDAGDSPAPTLAQAGIDQRPRQRTAPVPTLHAAEPDRGPPDADHALRQLRKAVTHLVAGGHSPVVLSARLGQWSRYDEGRRSVASDFAHELRAIADAVEQLP